MIYFYFFSFHFVYVCDVIDKTIYKNHKPLVNIINLSHQTNELLDSRCSDHLHPPAAILHKTQYEIQSLPTKI